jgi:hypothetical protein
MSLFKREDGTRRNKRLAGFFLAGAATLSGMGVAAAYWTASGGGTGNATSGTTQTVTVNQTTTVSGMYPGDTVALTGNFNNPNPGKVYITAVTASIGTFSSQTAGGLPACTQADFSITGTSNTPGEIASGNNVGSWSGLSITLIDNPTGNQNNCQNLTTIPITYSAS